MNLEMLNTMLKVTKNIWEALTSERTAEEVAAIFEITDEIRDKAMELFGLAKDISDDAVSIAVIAMDAAEHISDEAVTRAVAKPISEIMTAEDIRVVVVNRYRSIENTA